MANPSLAFGALAKPSKGKYWLEKKEAARARKSREQKAMNDAKRRDMAACKGCRWPTCEWRKQEPRIVAAHVFEHRKMGGDKTDTSERTKRELIMGLCFMCHAMVDRFDAYVEALTDAKTDGPCAFYERDTDTGRFYHVASERTIGVSEARR